MNKGVECGMKWLWHNLRKCDISIFAWKRRATAR